MNNLAAILTLFVIFSLVACSSSAPLKLKNKSPRGISVMNNADGQSVQKSIERQKNTVQNIIKSLAFSKPNDKKVKPASE